MHAYVCMSLLQVGHDVDHFSTPTPAGTSGDREHSISIISPARTAVVYYNADTHGFWKESIRPGSITAGPGTSTNTSNTASKNATNSGSTAGAHGGHKSPGSGQPAGAAAFDAAAAAPVVGGKKAAVQAVRSVVDPVAPALKAQSKQAKAAAAAKSWREKLAAETRDS